MAVIDSPVQHQDEENDCPIEQVRLTVPITDDPTMPALTFRTWSIGLTSCVLLAFLNQFFGLRENSIFISPVCVLIVSLPLGRFMASTLPTKKIRVPMTKWSFSLNPGPFNMKEHVLISIFASSGASSVYAVNILAIVKAFYHRKINALAAYLLSITTQLLGYGWAGVFRHFLVDSPYMWWPSNLVSVSLFRALHEQETRPKRGTTRLQFFLIVLISSFCYYIFPGFLFPSLTALSIACWIWPKSITAQQIGSGLYGLGIGSFTLDWSSISSFLGTPLATPWYAIANIMVGFFFAVYIVLPISYWTNSHEAKRFPIISSTVFNVNGTRYDTSRILDPKTFAFSEAAYNSYSKIYLSIFFLYNYGFGFATLTATLSHVLLFHGREIWQQSKAAWEKQFGDVHTRLMKKNYAIVPQWWFYILLVVVFALSVWTCEGFGKQMQLPYWGILLAVAIALLFTLPIGIITATTNQQPGLNIITELLIGYLYPGKPLANVCFKTYGYISMSQAISFLSDFKLGHYMKIPPRSMFVVQLIGTVVSSSVYFGTAWWLLTTVPNICDTSNLPEGSPWTCPGDNVFYSASIIWGVVGPGRMFGPRSPYSKLYYFFLAGFLAPLPVWLLSLKFPDVKWIRLINMPILLGSTMMMPPARSLTYLSWGAVGFLFNYVVYRRYKGWWARHNYVMAGALDAGIAFMAILLFFALQMKDIYGVAWWGMEPDDHCPLATCPTEPGIVVDGCPVIS